MNQTNNPSEIARETLRLLASRRIAPTPDSYRHYYQKISGQPDEAAYPGAERMLQQLAADLRLRSAGVRLVGALDQAALERNWPKFRDVLLELIDTRARRSPAASAWARLIRELLKQLEARHGSLTLAMKRDSLERVLAGSGADAAALAAKLRNLVASWAKTAPATVADPGLPDAPESRVAGGGAAECAAALPYASVAGAEGGLAELRELLAQTLDFAVISQLGHAPDLAAQARTLALAARTAAAKDAVAKLAAELRQFWFKLEVRGGEDTELHQGLLRLLRLLIDNTHDLLSEDQWMRGQVAVLQEIVSHPLDLGVIAEAERRLKDVIVKQGTLRNSLLEAKAALKQLITGFIDRLGELSASTGGYHDRLEGYAQRIRQTDDISQLNFVLADLIEDTRTAQLDTARTRDALLAARRQVETAEARVMQLERELEQVSELVQEDQLTGVLNRRGLDDAYEREAARTERTGTPLCVALLDVDNFKRLNDTYGHQAGDNALQHLVRVIKHTMRPSDVLTRYGGEEFMLLLPETQQEEALAVMVRLQRNLTKEFFLNNNERVLITFSAGVALRRRGEQREAIIERADKALYQAKRAGKNRVCVA